MFNVGSGEKKLIGAAALCVVVVLFGTIAVSQPAQGSVILTYNSTPLSEAAGAIHDPFLGPGSVDYNGTTATMFDDVMVVALDPTYATWVIANVIVEITMEHSFIGDLTIKLESAVGTVVTLVNRPGSGGPDNGSNSGGAGYSANLIYDYPITYSDDPALPADPPLPSAEDIGLDGLGVSLASDDVVGQSNGDWYQPDKDTAAGEGLLSAFDGQLAWGDWTLYLADSAAFDDGHLRQWSLRIELVPIPEPATIVLLLCGGVMMTRHNGRRRRV